MSPTLMGRIKFHSADLAPGHELSVSDDDPDDSWARPAADQEVVDETTAEHDFPTAAYVPSADGRTRDGRRRKRALVARKSQERRDPRYYSKELERERKKEVALAGKSGDDIAKELSDFTWFRLFIEEIDPEDDYRGLHTFEVEVECSHRRFYDCGRILENEDTARSMEYDAPRPKIPEWRDLTYDLR